MTLAKILTNDFINTITSLKDISFSFKDIIDVLIFGILIYIFIKLLQETQSWPIMIGIFSLAILYGLALIFDLPLTHLVLQSFFGVSLILIAVIFQRELRRFFLFFGIFNFAKNFIPPKENIINALVRAIFMLKNRRTGALFVFIGRESLDRHFEGGCSLNGELTEPLILSIFDESSPGHDGAMIIENNKIKRFATHLPLAEKNIERIRDFGLRHRAALGLTERSDAMVIIVSQEKQIVEISERGNLYKINNEKDLENKLINFYQNRFPKRNFIHIGQWLLKNLTILLASLAISLLIWLISYNQFIMIQKNISTTPDFKNLPDAYIMQNFTPQIINLTLKGRSSDLKSTDSEDTKIFIDLKNIQKEGWQNFQIESSNIKIPFNLSLIKIDPEKIKIQIIKRIIEKPAPTPTPKK